MTRHRYTAVGQLLLWALFLGPFLWAYFVWHWSPVRVFFVGVFAFFLFVAGLFTLGSLVDEVVRRRRSKVIAEAARHLNMRYYPGQFHRDSLPDEAWDSELLRSTDNDVRNLLHGVTPDADIKIFDTYVNLAVSEQRPWSANTRPRNVVRRFQQTVACVTAPALQLPRFSLLRAVDGDVDTDLSAKVSPLGLVELLRGEQAEVPVVLPASPAFSACYDLRSTDPQAAQKLFHSRVVSFLETESNVLVCGQGHVFLLFRENQLADAESVRELLETALQLAKLFSSSYHHG